MTFGAPLLLLTLLAVPLALGLYLLAERRRMRYAVRYTNVDVLALVAGGRQWRRLVAPLVFLLALTTLCVAVARPHVHTFVTSDKATVVLVLDVSGSMQSNDVKPSRLAAAQAALHLFLDRVPKRLKVGLVLFSGEAEVATPPTADHALVQQAVDAAGDFQGYGGTAIGDAIALAVQIGLQSVGISNPGASAAPSRTSRSLASLIVAAPPTPSEGLVSILFLSDGRQNRGLLEPLQGAARAKQAGIPVFTIAFGTNAGGSLPFSYGGGAGSFNFVSPNSPFGGGGGRAALRPDPATLRAIARVTGGQFYRARSAKAVQVAYTKLGSSLGRKPGNVEVTDWFLAGAALLLVVAGVLSALWSPRVP
ncbi:MAG TPA: VWA domain-containing protein [Gaiellaceae bacterium]|nr:VWA domain-containing protein [Gaiellaceae bacterium]